MQRRENEEGKGNQETFLEKIDTRKGKRSRKDKKWKKNIRNEEKTR